MSTLDGTLFVVDDDPAARRGAAALAASLGIPCETFASAMEFLDRWDVSRPGCLLTDLRLSGISGTELQLCLSAMGSTLPVILISAYADVSTAVQAMENGAVTVLEKPYEADALADAIRRAMHIDADRRAAARQRRDVSERLASLTPRELDVMDLLIAGEPHKIIAHRLGISLRTTARLCASVLARMGVETTMALVHQLVGIPLPTLATRNAAPGPGDDSPPNLSNSLPTQDRLLRTEGASPIRPSFNQLRMARRSK
jgi:FixJ family two-component response regulator